MAEVSEFYSGDLPVDLNRTLTWMLSRLNANTSPFAGKVVSTLTAPALAEGGLIITTGRFADAAQQRWPNIVFDPIFGVSLDDQPGPGGFPINYSPVPLLSGNLLVNALPLTTTLAVTGRALNLVEPASAYRVDVYSRTDVFYYQGSSAIAADGTWCVPDVHAGTVVAFLMPATAPQPAPGYSTPNVTGWTAHSNLGVGNKLKDHWVRIYSRTDLEYLQEDNVPIIVQDSTHARFGSSKVPAPGSLVAHVIYNDPELGPVDLYSTLQNQAAYSDLPRSIEVPPGDPDYADPGTVTGSNLAYIQNRCWIYDAALAIIALAVAGLWDAAARIVTRLNALRDNPGYLPSLILENAEDGSAARWSLDSGAGTVENVFDSTEPPPQSGGSRAISFTATSGPTFWRYSGSGLPDITDSIVEWRHKADVEPEFRLAITTSTGAVERINWVATGTAGYDPVSKAITVVTGSAPDTWRVTNQHLNSLIAQYLPNETLSSIDGFYAGLPTAGNLRLDNLTVGAPQPAGSLSFSYDVYNGQVDQAYIRSGAMAWVCYAYAIYMERTGDFGRATLGLQGMLEFLFSLQFTGSGPRHNLIQAGWGRYQDPGYQYVPGQLDWISTEHNLDCYFAFDKAARVLPTAALNLLNRSRLTPTQYASLITTATTASTKAGEIRAAILDQLWIPPSDGVPGHFAQGASESGLDTALALDAAGSWAALFCREIEEEAKAVECLKFIYETFFLTSQQLLKSSQPDSYNQAYEQLTRFDGFKPYADSPGGYSGSPDSVWMEGSWGALAALLRLRDNFDLQTYFSAHYQGGLDGFLARLVQSLKIVHSTTPDGGVLSFSLAARALPWEFSVRKTLASAAWFWITATRNDILFCTTSTALLGRPYLKTPQGVQQSIQQLEGQSSIGALELEAIDGAGFVTALASGGKLEGRKVTLKVGYPGMGSSDFVTLVTQQIESVQPTPDLTGYVFECRDLQRSAKTRIFTQGDDGSPISRDHPRTLVANPIDAVLMVLQNELGLGQVPDQPKSAWRIYDPAQWDPQNGTNPTLIYPNPYVDVDGFLAFRNDIFAGYIFEFCVDQPLEAKQFLETKIFRALGGYLVVLSDGRLSPRFFVPPYTLRNLFTFNERNITAVSAAARHPLINQVTYRMDYDGSRFGTELLFVCAPSLQQFGLAGHHLIESKGLKAARGGISLAALGATRIFRRYGGLDAVSGAPNGGAAMLTVTTHFMTLTVEVGDYVYLSHPLLPDFESGRRGVSNRIFEVFEKQPNYAQGTMTYRLLDTNWIRSKKLSRVAPTGTPAWPDATQAQRDRYMFICLDSTKKHGDGTAGKTIW